MAPKKELWWWVATWFGAGKSPVASGTAGSLAALPFAYLIHVTFGNIALLIASFVMFFVGTWAANQFLAHENKGKDPGEIVVDEVAGQWLILSVLFPTWQSYLVGFFLFRIFDVLKPWPVSWADQEVGGGAGIMLDDMLAAVYPVCIWIVVLITARLSDASDMLMPVFIFLNGLYVY